MMAHQLNRWQDFIKITGQDALLGDAKFATTDARMEHRGAWITKLDQVFLQKDFATWRQLLTDNNLIFGYVSKTEDLLDDPQMQASGAIKPLAADNSGATQTIDRIGGVEKRPAGPAPMLGEHTDEVLRDYGYDDAAIEKLRSVGAIP